MLNKDFITRRKKILKAIGPDGVGILPAAAEATRSGDTTFPYRQDSDFYYLTGFPESEAVAVFVPGHEQGEFILFNRSRDPEKEIWHGPRAGQEGACEQYGADCAFPITEMALKLPKLLQNRKKVYYDLGRYCDFDVRLLACIEELRQQVRRGINAPSQFISLKEIIHDMRLIKSETEIESMRYAAEVSVNAHRRAMAICKPGLMEYQLAAAIHYEFQQHDCLSPAYESIVGGGKNSCVLHYVNNNEKLNDGDLVLIDAGAEYKNYAADITRTFPVNAHFTKEQKLIYEIVLKAQLAGIDAVKPGAPWTQIEDIIVPIVTEGLVELGLLKGEVDSLIEAKAYLKFYMHKSGHWLGLDVHDAGSYKENGEWRQLKPGMVLTVEPGIYIAADPDIDKKWWNIGVRIEDDVLVTKTGHEVLSGALEKEVDAIEALMNQKT